MRGQGAGPGASFLFCKHQPCHLLRVRSSLGAPPLLTCPGSCPGSQPPPRWPSDPGITPPPSLRPPRLSNASSSPQLLVCALLFLSQPSHTCPGLQATACIEAALSETQLCVVPLSWTRQPLMGAAHCDSSRGHWGTRGNGSPAGSCVGQKIFLNLITTVKAGKSSPVPFLFSISVLPDCPIKLDDHASQFTRGRPGLCLLFQRNYQQGLLSLSERSYFG